MACCTVERFTIFQSTDVSFRFRVTLPSLVNSDAEDPGYNPLGLVDITDWEIEYQWKADLGDADPVLSKSTENSGEIDLEAQTPLPWDEDSTRGEGVINIEPADTDPDVDDNPEPGSYFADLVAILTDTDKRKVLIAPSPVDLRELGNS